MTDQAKLVDRISDALEQAEILGMERIIFGRSGLGLRVDAVRALTDLLASKDGEIAELKAEIEAHQCGFDLRWKADRRGTEKWQAAGEGRELAWPDHADLVVFLLESLDAEREVRAIAEFLLAVMAACAENQFSHSKFVRTAKAAASAQHKRAQDAEALTLSLRELYI